MREREGERECVCVFVHVPVCGVYVCVSMCACSYVGMCSRFGGCWSRPPGEEGVCVCVRTVVVCVCGCLVSHVSCVVQQYQVNSGVRVRV